MPGLKEIVSHLQKAWNRLSATSRAFVAAGGLVMIVMVVLTGIWSARPKFVTLANGLSPAETAELISKLEAEGINAKMNFAASAVLVPKNKWNRARTLAGDSLVVSHEPTSDFGNAVLGDPDMNHFRRLRQREESLARTIRRMDGIVDAVVHIAQPEPTPFVSEQRPATASVVIELRPGAPFMRGTAASVVALVSDSIEGVEPDGVSVMDTRGRVWVAGGETHGAEVTGQFEHQRQLEIELATKANSMLTRMLGPQKAIVKVSASVDFTRTERKATIYDPDVKVRESEDIRLVTTTSEGPASGAAGGNSLTVAGDAGVSKTVEETNTTKYLNGQTLETVTQLPGRIERLTVAVMVHDGSTEEAVDGATAEAPPLDLQRIEAVVKQAIGFDETRGDQIEVMSTTFAGLETEENLILAAEKWDRYYQLARSSSLGIAAVVAFGLGLLTIFRLRPLTVRVGEDDSELQRRRTLAELSGRVKENPDVMKAVLSAWLNEDDAKTSRDDSNARRKAA